MSEPLPNNLPDLAFSCFKLQFIAMETIHLPPFPGKLFHGALGHALYNFSQTNGLYPNNNPLRENAYNALFKPEKTISSGALKNINNPPPPYVFRFKNQYALKIPSLHQFSMKILLFGSANQYSAELIEAMRLLGEQGFSQKKARLYYIEQENEPTNQGTLPSLIDKPDNIKAPKTPIIPQDPPAKIRVVFITPYLANGRLAKSDFDISLWLMGVIRRMALLQNSYSSQQSDTDFLYLKSLTEQITVHDAQLYYYKTTQSQKNHTSGLLGFFDLSLIKVKDLWPWLYLGQWIHAGKKTSYGFGRYKLLWVED